jgi:hypothetical protein
VSSPLAVAAACLVSAANPSSSCAKVFDNVDVFCSRFRRKQHVKRVKIVVVVVVIVVIVVQSPESLEAASLADIDKLPSLVLGVFFQGAT